MNNSMPKRTGKGMFFIAWIIILGVGTYFFYQYQEKQKNPNMNPVSQTGESGERTVVLKRNPQGHYLVSGLINKHPVTFFLDTGATTVVIPEKIAKKIGLPSLYPTYSSTANGTIETSATLIDKLTFGSIELEMVPAQINPHMEYDEILLGMSALKQVEFTQKGNELILRQVR